MQGRKHLNPERKLQHSDNAWTLENRGRGPGDMDNVSINSFLFLKSSLMKSILFELEDMSQKILILDAMNGCFAFVYVSVNQILLQQEQDVNKKYN